MLKKIALVSAIMAVTSGVALANPAPYIGAGLGITTNTSTNATSGTGVSQAGTYRGVPFNVFAGYGGVVSQNIYLAGEVFGTVGNGEISNKAGLKTSYGYGASVIPGVSLSDKTTAFVRAGVVRTRFSNQNTMSTGGQLGLGMQTSLTQNVDLRGEYDYTAYRSAKLVKSPRQDAFNLGLVYKFD